MCISQKSRWRADRRVIHVQILPPSYAILKQARTTELFNKANTIIEEVLTDTSAKKQLIYCRTLPYKNPFIHIPSKQEI